MSIHPTTEDTCTHPEWFCLRTQIKREHIASAMMEGIEAVQPFCPRVSQIKKTRAGKKRFLEAMFPGYIFARFVFREKYRQVIHAQGVRYLVAHGNRRAIPENVIEELRAEIPSGIAEAPDPSVEPGADIECVTGSLKGLNGRVLAHLPAQNRVQILLEILGREIKVAVSADDVLPASERT
ncbi:MAG: transcription termination/antitermination protein NusG [Opitutales bacterium]